MKLRFPIAVIFSLLVVLLFYTLVFAHPTSIPVRNSGETIVTTHANVQLQPDPQQKLQVTTPGFKIVECVIYAVSNDNGQVRSLPELSNIADKERPRLTEQFYRDLPPVRQSRGSWHNGKVDLVHVIENIEFAFSEDEKHEGYQLYARVLFVNKYQGISGHEIMVNEEIDRDWVVYQLENDGGWHLVGQEYYNRAYLAFLEKTSHHQWSASKKVKFTNAVLIVLLFLALVVIVYLVKLIRQQRQRVKAMTQELTTEKNAEFFCDECGASVADQSARCPNCGATFDSTSAE